ncbi:MAG: hypothetical protein K6T78_10155 [Alicyclobacillus sp.]|nr:hypothetical protein [Alicyclobacillus sp.]
MKVVKVLWGLLVDDGRLAISLVVGLVIAYILRSAAHLPLVASILIWVSLIFALWFSIEHQLRLKLKK